MSKKQYQKPAFQVFKLSNRARLLVGSPEPGTYIPRHDIHDDDKHLA